MFGIGMHEILIILAIALVIFGARRLPEIGSGIGKAIHNFKLTAAEPKETDAPSKS